MANKFTRTVKYTHVEYGKIEKTDAGMQVKYEGTHIENGVISEDKIAKIIRKKYGATTCIISINIVEETREMSFDDFIAHSTVVTATEEETETETETETEND